MAPANTFQHIVVTRYFVRFSSASTDVGAMLAPDRKWLDDRFEIFRTVCFPSVVAQTEQDFVWLLFFDVNTPGDQLQRVRDLIAGHANIRIVLCESFDETTRAREIRAELAPDTKWLLTTRLDNDDGWRRDFVATLHNALAFERREFLNYPVGIIFYAGMTFLYRHQSNAFISLLEPVDGFMTVWCGQHLELARMAPIRQLPPIPAFLQMVHAGTRSNKPRGVRVHRLLALEGFEAMNLPHPDRPERDLDLVLFNVTSVPRWALRDRLVALLRRLSRRNPVS